MSKTKKEKHPTILETVHKTAQGFDNSPWISLLNSISKFSPDFMELRDQPKEQKRVFPST